jgi:hypothetical protein
MPVWSATAYADIALLVSMVSFMAAVAMAYTHPMPVMIPIMAMMATVFHPHAVLEHLPLFRGQGLVKGSERWLRGLQGGGPRGEPFLDMGEAFDDSRATVRVRHALQADGPHFPGAIGHRRSPRVPQGMLFGGQVELDL